MGLSKVPFCVLILTRRTCPCLSGNISVIRPIGQEFRGELSSMISIMSPHSRFVLTSFQFLPLLQQWKVLSCPAFPEEIRYVLDLFPSPSGKEVTFVKESRWKRRHPFHLKQMVRCQGFWSFASSDKMVIGRSFMIASTSHRAVWRLSSSRVCSFVME